MGRDSHYTGMCTRDTVPCVSGFKAKAQMLVTEMCNDRQPAVHYNELWVALFSDVYSGNLTS